MHKVNHAGGATVMPTMRYRNAAAALEWLIKAFGFEKKVAYTGENGEITHAELTYGNGLVMLGSVRNDEYGRYVGNPLDLGGKSTQCIYVIVSDVKWHYTNAVASGARIAVPLKEEPYGSMYCCMDLEGHLWSFGDYDPWAPQTAA